MIAIESWLMSMVEVRDQRHQKTGLMSNSEIDDLRGLATIRNEKSKKENPI